jgi:osmotically-inducible protein OsmY
MVSSAQECRRVEKPISREQELSRRVTECLWSSNLPALRRVSVEVRRNTVILRGKVGSFYDRQIAVARAATVAGVARVVDVLEVKS